MMNAIASLEPPSALKDVIYSDEQSSADFISRIVAAAREHLGADLGFLCEFENGKKVIRHSSGGIHGRPLSDGTRFDLEETYCRRVAQGALPNIIHDARSDPRVCHMDITKHFDIGTYISVPVTIPGGRVFGTLCCISHEVDGSVHSRDVKFLRVLGDLLGAQLGEQERIAADRAERVERLRHLARHGLQIVFQPIVSLEDGSMIGMEALARFDTTPYRTPDAWFADAWEVGLGEELELAALRAALAHRARMPDDVYLAVNLSPKALQSAELVGVLDGVRNQHIVIEVTEHAAVGEYEPLVEALGRCSARGVRIAVDDFGAGYSGLSHALRIRPRLLKLDMQLTRDIHCDAAKQALAAATVGFASRTSVEVVAEGVETQAEADMLRSIGVRFGQGFLFGRPAPLAA